MGHDDAAAPLIDSLRAISPAGREARVGAATLAARRQKYADAFVLFDAWAAEHPDDGDAVLSYARARSWSGGDAGAAALYARVIAREPNNAEALIGAAEVEGRQGRFAEALARLEAPSLADNLDARVTRARVLTWAGRFRDAVAAYAFVEQRDSTRREAVIGRADL
jgi:tetratricopeptide (TPR) repeat protein